MDILRPKDQFFDAIIPKDDNLVPKIVTPVFENEKGKFQTIYDQFANPKSKAKFLNVKTKNGGTKIITLSSGDASFYGSMSLPNPVKINVSKQNYHNKSKLKINKKS